MGTPFSVVERLDGDRCVAYCNQDCNAKQDDKENGNYGAGFGFSARLSVELFFLSLAQLISITSSLGTQRLNLHGHHL